MVSVKFKCLVAHDADDATILLLHHMVRTCGLKSSMKIENRGDGLFVTITLPHAAKNVGALLVQAMNSALQPVRLVYKHEGPFQAKLKVPLATAAVMPAWVRQRLTKATFMALDVTWADDAVAETGTDADTPVQLARVGIAVHQDDKLSALGMNRFTVGFLRTHDILDKETLCAKSELELRALRVLNPDKMDEYIRDIHATLARAGLALRQDDAPPAEPIKLTGS